MSGDSSEEKNLPPSLKKLRDARRKGQISKSRDFVGALGLGTGAIFLVARSGALIDRSREALLQAYRLQNEPFATAVPQLLASLIELIAEIVVPLFALMVATTLLGSLIANQGIVFSIEPLKPKLESLNPINGIGRMFGMKALIELGKSIAKVVLLGSALFNVVLGTLRPLVLIPGCGLGCFGSTFAAQAKLILWIGAGASLAVGLADVLVQRWLFLRDMKMSTTEQKREYKEQEGDPHVRNAHRRHRQEAASLPRTGLKRATVLICGSGVVVGMRYVASEGIAPTVVCRARDGMAEAMLAAAAELRIPSVADEWLASALAKKVPPGQTLPNRYFERAAQVIYSTMQV